MKSLALATILCAASLTAFATDYTVKPKVTQLPNIPSRVLLVGNSFMYYNCGVNGYISGISKPLGIKMKTTMATIGGARTGLASCQNLSAQRRPGQLLHAQ